jgi:hypothetical protein
MDKRDLEDVKMQAREGVRGVMDEVHKEQTDTEITRAIGEMWNQLPPDIKAQMAQDKPDVVKAMNEMYGGEVVEQPQGNPWGDVKNNPAFSGTKGR